VATLMTSVWADFIMCVIENHTRYSPVLKLIIQTFPCTAARLGGGVAYVTPNKSALKWWWWF